LIWCGVIFGGRPIFTPRALARVRPSPVRGADQLVFELRQSTEDGQHQAAMRARGVGPRVAEGSETRFAVGNSAEGVQQIPIAPGDRALVTISTSPASS